MRGWGGVAGRDLLTANHGPANHGPDRYKGLDAASLDQTAVAYAQANLRILCGLYGQLRACDLIQVLIAGADAGPGWRWCRCRCRC